MVCECPGVIIREELYFVLTPVSSISFQVSYQMYAHPWIWFSVLDRVCLSSRCQKFSSRVCHQQYVVTGHRSILQAILPLFSQMVQKTLKQQTLYACVLMTGCFLLRGDPGVPPLSKECCCCQSSTWQGLFSLKGSFLFKLSVFLSLTLQIIILVQLLFFFSWLNSKSKYPDTHANTP